MYETYLGDRRTDEAEIKETTKRAIDFPKNGMVRDFSQNGHFNYFLGITLFELLNYHICFKYHLQPRFQSLVVDKYLLPLTDEIKYLNLLAQFLGKGFCNQDTIQE